MPRHTLTPVRSKLAYLIVAAMLAGCATPKGGPGQSAANGAEDPCSVGRSALAGAAAGALLGAVIGGKDGAAKGALLGGAVGAVACVTINVQSRQTKSAEQSDREYRQAKGTLPPNPVVVSYASQLGASAMKRGESLKVSSVLELVNGTAKPVQEVREELLVFNPDGSPIKNGSKPFTASSGGRYENQFELRLPANAPQGAYKLKTKLYVNGESLAERDLSTQLVWDGNSAVLVATR